MKRPTTTANNELIRTNVVVKTSKVMNINGATEAFLIKFLANCLKREKQTSLIAWFGDLFHNQRNDYILNGKKSEQKR